MPYRKTVIALEEIYHIFNRSVARQPIFTNINDYKRGISLIRYYQYFRPPIRFSHYNRLPAIKRNDLLFQLENNAEMRIEILAFCLMPNHFHFLIKEVKEDGISTFMKNFQNSYAKYFNTKYDRTGSVFQSMFKIVRMETNEQLIHVARYIHLNPYTSYLVKTPPELEKYLWSSFPLYVNNNTSTFINPQTILGQFPTLSDFKKFTLDQSDYQRELDLIKHLSLE